MAYVSLYRKYRSQTFGDLMGQDHVVRILRNGISSGRIAHAYLFTGPRGTGKTSSARLLAKALCCEKGPSPEPCNECEICQSITDGTLIDVFEMDAASESGVEQVRETIVNTTEYRPAIARYKIFIIDEVHDLSSKAFDALLKTIEEPPAHVIFILATTEYNKVPPTIRSRCQKFEFHRAGMQDLVKRLSYVAAEEGISMQPAAAAAIARMADGGFRDALTLLEQASLTAEGEITLQHVYDQLGLIPEEMADKILLAVRDGQVPELLGLLDETGRLGRDPRTILESLLHRIADLTRAAYGLESSGAEGTREASMHETAMRIGVDELLRLRGSIAEAHKVIRDITLPKLWFESELVRLASPQPAVQATEQVATPLKSAPPTSVKAPPEHMIASAPPSPSNGGGTAKVESPPQQEPTPAVVEQESPMSFPVPIPTGDAALDAAREAWSAVVSKLPENTAIGKKLHNSRITSFDGGRAVVELPRKFDVEWMTDDPKRAAHIIKSVREVAGQEWQITYQAGNGKPKSESESTAVELPAEGQKLAEMAREILGK